MARRGSLYATVAAVLAPTTRLIELRQDVADDALRDPGFEIVGPNIRSKGERIYHVPGGQYYGRTRIEQSKGERWFCSENESAGRGAAAIEAVDAMTSAG